jgi:hypothetical protein
LWLGPWMGKATDKKVMKKGDFTKTNWDLPDLKMVIYPRKMMISWDFMVISWKLMGFIYIFIS